MCVSEVIFIEGDGNGGVGQNGEVLLIGSQGTVNFSGGVQDNGPGDQDALFVPVENDGTFNLFGSTPGSPPAWATTLKVYGSDPLTDNVSFEMEGVDGVAYTNLSGGVCLYADQGYRQTGPGYSAYLDDADSNTEFVKVGNAAGIYIGLYTYIWFTHYGSSFGSLTLTGNVTMNGALHVNINGTQSDLCDVLNVNGTMAWNRGSSISVYILGFQLDTGLSWNIFHANSLTGMGNVAVSPATLSLDSSQWSQGNGTLDS